MTDKYAQYSNDELNTMGFHTLDLKKLTEYCDPFRGCWIELADKPITKKEVIDCIKAGEAELVETPSWIELTYSKKELTPEEIRYNHVKKIAYFATNEMQKPISIDVGIPELNAHVDHIIDDGNHRLAGAIIRKDKEIKAYVSGSEKYAKEMGLWNPNEYHTASMDRFIKQMEARRNQVELESNIDTERLQPAQPVRAIKIKP